jgi:hypothetical protein
MWHQLKQTIKDGTNVTDVGMHVLLGIGIYIVLLVALRRPKTAFGILFLLNLANETIDLLEGATSSSGLGSAFMDSLATLAAPLSIMLLTLEAQNFRKRRRHLDMS